MSRKPHYRLSVEEKVALIRQYEMSHISMQDLARQFGITYPTATSIIRDKKRWLKRLSSPEPPTGRHAQLETQLWNDFLKANLEWDLRKVNRWLTSRALVIAKNLGIKDFKASYHWLYNFKIRNKLHKKTSLSAVATISASTTSRSSANSTLPSNELDFETSLFENEVKFLPHDNFTDEHLPSSYCTDPPSSSEELVDSLRVPNPNHLLNGATDAEGTYCPNSDSSQSTSSFEQQMLDEQPPNFMATIAAGKRQQPQQQPQLSSLEVTTSAKSAVSNKERPPKGSREEAIEAATTLIRYVTLNTTDFDASSSSFLAMLTGYLNKLISSRPSL